MTTQMMNMMITKFVIRLLATATVITTGSDGCEMVTITMMLNYEMTSMTSKKIFWIRKYWVLAKESESDQDDDIKTLTCKIKKVVVYQDDNINQWFEEITVKQVAKRSEERVFIICNDQCINMTISLLLLLLSRPHTKLF